MTSLALTSPPAVKIPSSSSSLFSRSSILFRNTESRSRICVSGYTKCNLPKALNVGNGNARAPIINETTIPKFFDSSRLEKSVSRNNTKLKLFSGTANPALSQEIAWYMGLELGKVSIKRFADGEIYVQLKESVRGCDVFLVQPTCTPTNENLMELLIMVDACRRASAKKVTAVIPYFGYARADRKKHKWHSETYEIL
ncbi:PREDICTED: ribose-phosphate pyrophosphokinase 2, chloroplastic-like [Camelina sativa]|uniref:Ribose-phosphate pyrophosphokinase 2, chloroplastic-like n=1 Tax=Camelina sativa TaxID=90675 RepID=A0ABM0YJ41_CAMSA|nr:PREDICTED: ribose-phosphate pyrophosphokinase 2, chloroplastic-like [Camelina sativa]